MKNKIIYSGAEAILYLENGNLIKERIPKGYRHEYIDNQKRKYPTRKEEKLLKKAKEIGLNVPFVISVDDKSMKVTMEYIKGDVLRDSLDNYSKKKRQEVCIKIGQEVALMHDNDIVHADLTTSNMILFNDKVYFVDFGLGFISKKDEDKAVDIHLLKQAFESKHYMHYEDSFRFFLKGYRKSKNYSKIIERLEKVEKRGRYKRKLNY